MKCFYCNKEAVGIKATDYFNTAPTCFRGLCKKHWGRIHTKYYDEEDFEDKSLEE